MGGRRVPAELCSACVCVQLCLLAICFVLFASYVNNSTCVFNIGMRTFPGLVRQDLVTDVEEQCARHFFCAPFQTHPMSVSKFVVSPKQSTHVTLERKRGGGFPFRLVVCSSQVELASDITYFRTEQGLPARDAVSSCLRGSRWGGLR